MAEPSTPALSHDLVALDLCSGSEAVDSHLNTAQMLSLIDSILPFEACLYHQIIPLSVESSCLHLGMVNPADTTASDYARRQASFIHCSIVSWPVASDWQRKMLSRYLSHASRCKAKTPAAAKPPPAPYPNEEMLTFIVDSPEQISGEEPPSPPPPVQPSPVSPLALVPDPALASLPLACLHQLSPPRLAQALLLRVLSEGIGRLFFERDTTQGRVLWSQDGVVKAALKPLSIDQFQSVINEFKRLTHLPLLPTTQTKQADIERLFQGDRVLLRLRLIAGTQGEEATLQVLRGAALKFYQQQQLKQMGEDAIGVARTLQKRISDIREQARNSLTLESPPALALESLSQLLKTMEEQVEQIMRSPIS
jgi:hypothetical protein